MNVRSLVLCLFLLTAVLLSQCKKNSKSTTPVSGSSLPTVSTLSVYTIQDSIAYVSANVTSSGSSSMKAVGICYDVNPNPVLGPLSHTLMASGTGSFSTPIGPLNANTTYYVRAFASNGNGTAYGNQITFKTLPPFSHVTSGLPNSGNGSCAAVLTQGSTVYSGWNSGGVFKSVDKGDTWTSAGLNNQSVGCLLAGGNYIFAGTLGGVYRSADGGSSWTSAASTPANFTVSSMAYSNGSVFAGNNDGLFVSTDDGNTWNPVNGFSQIAIYFVRVSGNVIYTGGRAMATQTVLKSVDNGLTWAPFGQVVSSPVIAVLDLAVTGSNVYAAATNGLYRSADNGNSWAIISGDNAYTTKVISSGSFVYAGGGPFSNFYFSKDNGTSFSSLADPGGASYSIDANTDYVYLGTAKGLYRWPLQ